MGSGALMKSKFQIVLSALEDGQTIEVDGQKYCFGEDDQGNPVLCWELTRVNLDNDFTDEKFLGKADVSFSYFYNACNKLSEETIIGIVAGNVLRKKR
jgi:hypothetical protein